MAVYCIKWLYILCHRALFSVTRTHRYIEIPKCQAVKRQGEQEREVQYITFSRPGKFSKDACQKSGEQGVGTQSVQVCNPHGPRWMTERAKPINICTQSQGTECAFSNVQPWSSRLYQARCLTAPGSHFRPLVTKKGDLAMRFSQCGAEISGESNSLRWQP